MGLAYGGVNLPTNVVVAGRLGRRLGFFLSIKQSGVPVGGLLAGLVLPPIAIAYGWQWALVAAVCLLAAVAVSARLLRNAAVLDPAGSAGGKSTSRAASCSAWGSSASSCRGRSGRSSPT